MKAFHCDACGALVFFENVQCVGCGHVLGFLPDVMDLAALEPTGDTLWKSLSGSALNRSYRVCANGRRHAVCNWLIPAEDSEELCTACRANAEIPETPLEETRLLWHKLEIAKRRLLYTLRRLSLSVDGYPARLWPRLQFRFPADTPGALMVLTGHESGVITVNLAEADDVEREKRRTQFGESQRTLMGHFRHESGHYYWNALIPNSPNSERFRTLFGDERRDYGEALQAYYTNGAATDWPLRCVSAYASAHPWEDWAETWGHFLQMVDALETAASFGISIRPSHPAAKTISADPQAALARGGFDTLLEHWLPLTYALNSLNRSVGVPDAYPFVLPPLTLEKLRFIHDVVHSASQASGSEAGATAPTEPLTAAY